MRSLAVLHVQPREPAASTTSRWVKTTFDQPHVLNAVGSWKPGKGFELGVRFQLASGRPDTPVIGSTYDADTGKLCPVRGALRSTRTPLYRQLDVRAEKVWLYNTWSLGLYIEHHQRHQRRERRGDPSTTTAIAIVAGDRLPDPADARPPGDW